MMANEIFISYRRADEGWARLLYAQLKAEGIDAWYDAQVGAGEDWRTATARALESARVFVLLFTAAAAQSEDIAKELAAATFSKKLIVPVRIEDIQPSGAFLYELAGRNWINAFENTEAKLGELARSLAQLVRSGAPNPAMLPFDRNAGEVPPVAVTPRIRSRWGIGTAAALAVLAVAGAAFGLLRDRAPATSVAQKTAFFGFEPAVDDPDVKTIANSASSEVFDALGAMRLATAARAETFGTPPGERFQRARQLGAIYSLGGEVLREATQITISIRLEDVGTRSTLWSESVSGPVNETVALPVRAATLATDTLRCVATLRGSLRRDDIETVKLLPGFCREKRTTSLASIPVFRELVRAVPDVAEAQAGFAVATLIVLPGAPETARPALLAEAEVAADRAMQLNSHLPDAWLARYWVASRKGASLIEMDAVLAEGLKLAPEDATLNQYHATLLQSVGRNRDSVPYARLAVTNDPLSGPKQTGFASLLAITGQTAEAEAAIEQLMKRTPSAGRWQMRVSNAILHGVGNPRKLLAEPPAMVSIAVADCWRAVFASYLSADKALRRSGIESARICHAGGSFALNTIVPVLASLGDLDGAFGIVDEPARADSPRSSESAGFLFWPSTQALRADARFLPLVRKLELIEYWQKTGTHPDVCDTEMAPFCEELKSSTQARVERTDSGSG